MLEPFTLLGTPNLFPWVALFVGLCVGSFLNVVIHRLPRMMERDWAMQCAELRGESPPSGETLSLMAPRSRCPDCGHQIRSEEHTSELQSH